MLTEWLNPPFAIFYKSYYLCFTIAMFLSPHLQINNVTRNSKWDKHDKFIYSCQSFPLCCIISYCYIF